MVKLRCSPAQKNSRLASIESKDPASLLFVDVGHDTQVVGLNILFMDILVMEQVNEWLESHWYCLKKALKHLCQEEIVLKGLPTYPEQDSRMAPHLLRLTVVITKNLWPVLLFPPSDLSDHCLLVLIFHHHIPANIRNFIRDLTWGRTELGKKCITWWMLESIVTTSWRWCFRPTWPYRWTIKTETWVSLS